MQPLEKTRVLFINMASGFGGGEFQTEQLMRGLNQLEHYELFFFGKSSGKLKKHLAQTAPFVQLVNLWQLLKLVLSKRSLIIHAQDGRGAHLAAILKKISGKPTVITRHVAFPFKRKSSTKSYQQADRLVGVSQKITEILKALNPNSQTIYGCIKPLQENPEFEQRYFSPQKAQFHIGHIGNFQPIKNFPLTIELAQHFPQHHFYLVGSGELENELKQQANGLNNLYFIPFTDHMGSVFKQLDLQLVPSHSEGLGGIILEGYQYQVPVIAHATGGIPEIVQQDKTGYLSEKNQLADYQAYLTELTTHPEKLNELKQQISQFCQQRNFTAERMAEEYHQLYQQFQQNTH
ncbi:MAG: glycosyltransferase family 4 protein [Pasteurellaceae bacterium]|nr:glycosyltransferase family 4 protein [Pasteurellaceae bacterium]